MIKFILLIYLLMTCDFPETSEEYERFQKIKPIIDKNCGECHVKDGEQSEFTFENFKSSNSASMLLDGKMPPPPNVISPEDKDKLLTYLSW